MRVLVIRKTSIFAQYSEAATFQSFSDLAAASGRSSSGSLANLAARRRASSRINKLAVERCDAAPVSSPCCQFGNVGVNCSDRFNVQLIGGSATI